MPAKLPPAGRLACGGSPSSLRSNVPSRHYTINVQGNVKAACDAGPRAGFVFNDINQLIWYLLGVRIRRPYWPVTVEEYQMPVGAVAINSPKTLEFETQTPLWTGGVGSDGDLAIHPTGLLGGMRWWLEALLRAVGAEVPDPDQCRPDGLRRG